VQALVETCDRKHDEPMGLIQAVDFKKHWKIHPSLLHWLKITQNSNPVLDELKSPGPLHLSRWRYPFNRIAISKGFKFFIIISVLWHLGITVWELILRIQDLNEKQDEQMCDQQSEFTFAILNLIFIVIYSIECFIKMIGLGCKLYFCGSDSKWNYLDIFILFVTALDVIMGFLPCNTSTLIVVEVIGLIKLLKLLRAVRFLKLITLGTFNIFCLQRINEKLFLGYDIAKGLVTGIEETLKLIPYITSNSKIVAFLKTSLERERLETIKLLGLLQKEHPGIAVAVKTRHASRAVLNQMLMTLRELKSDG